MRHHRRRRRGYALVMVIVFVVLFTAVLGVAWRQVASALRVEHFSEVRRQCDDGSLRVMAAAMNTLETGLRWDGGVAKINGSSNGTVPFKKSLIDAQGNTKWYTIVFNRDNNDGTNWTVNVTCVPSDPGGDPLP
jgi:hypothetical protein